MEDLKNVEIKIEGISDSQPIEKSSLFKITLTLNSKPPSKWIEAFNHFWKRPREYSGRHAPNIASIQGNSIIMDGTTSTDIENIHKKTLLIVVEDSNKYYNEWVQSEIEKKKKEELDKKKRDDEANDDLEKGKNVKF
jgi:hypothetical protein